MPYSKLLIYIGKYFKDNEFGNWTDIQHFLVTSGEANISKEEIEVMLECLVMGDTFLEKFADNLYCVKQKVIVRQEVIKNVVDFASLGMPMYAPEL